MATAGLMDFNGPGAPHGLMTDAQLATIIDDDAHRLRERHELLTIWIAPDAVLTPSLQFDAASGSCRLSPIIAGLITEAARVPGTNPHCEVCRWLTAPTELPDGFQGLPPYLTLHTDPDRMLAAFQVDQARRRRRLEGEGGGPSVEPQVAATARWRGLLLDCGAGNWACPPETAASILQTAARRSRSSDDLVLLVNS